MSSYSDILCKLFQYVTGKGNKSYFLVHHLRMQVALHSDGISTARNA